VARLVSEGLRAQHPGGSECDERARSRWMRPALQGIKPPARRGARVTKGRRGGAIGGEKRKGEGGGGAGRVEIQSIP